MNINIELLSYQLDQAGLPVVGVASTGRIDYSRLLTPTEQTLSDNIVASHDPNGILPWQQDEVDSSIAKVSFRTIPNYATWTPQETSDNITNFILSGKSKAQIDSDIAALPATIAGMKTGLTVVAEAIIDVRTVLAILGKLVTFLRIIAVRR